MLTSGRLVPSLHQTGFPFARIVVEATEHTSIDDYSQVVAARAELKDLGFGSRWTTRERAMPHCGTSWRSHRT